MYAENLFPVPERCSLVECRSSMHHFPFYPVIHVIHYLFKMKLQVKKIILSFTRIVSYTGTQQYTGSLFTISHILRIKYKTGVHRSRPSIIELVFATNCKITVKEVH